jgi:hypothetical protein
LQASSTNLPAWNEFGASTPLSMTATVLPEPS